MGKNIYIGVDNVARKVKQPYIGIDNIARKVKSGFIGVNNVARQFFSGGTPLSALGIGTVVKLNESGVAQEYIVVNQGIPSGSSLYDSSCNGTWLLRKDIYGTNSWDSTNNNKLNESSIHTYLNNTFFGLFDSKTQSAIKQVKIPYCVGGGSGTVQSGTNGLSTKIFLLSCYEVGWTNGTYRYFPIDGACLSYFQGTSLADSKRIAYLNGTATIWYLRSAMTSDAMQVAYVLKNGDYGIELCVRSNGIRPALIMPFETLVGENMNVIVT